MKATSIQDGGPVRGVEASGKNKAPSFQDPLTVRPMLWLKGLSMAPRTSHPQEAGYTERMTSLDTSN